MHRLAALAAAAALLLAGSACAPTATSGGALRVVGTVTPVSALVKVVGGERIALTALLKSSVDPHDYEPQAGDVRAIAAAQVIVKNGAGLETWLDKLIENSGTSARVVDASQGIRLRKGDDRTPAGDPHIWHAIPNAIIMLNNIRDGLALADPAGAATYRANAAAYEAKLIALDATISSQIATIPAERRKLVTSHDTFGYYAERYGLKIVGAVIPSLDTNAQPSAKELAELVRTIRNEGVRAVFTEASINPALARRIAQEAGVKVVEGGLYGDTLGPAGSGTDTLDGMLQHNTQLIVANLR